MHYWVCNFKAQRISNTCAQGDLYKANCVNNIFILRMYIFNKSIPSKDSYSKVHNNVIYNTGYILCNIVKSVYRLQIRAHKPKFRTVITAESRREMELGGRATRSFNSFCYISFLSLIDEIMNINYIILYALCILLGLKIILINM